MSDNDKEADFELIRSELCCTSKDAIRSPSSVSLGPYTDLFGSVSQSSLRDPEFVRRVMLAQIANLVKSGKQP